MVEGAPTTSKLPDVPNEPINFLNFSQKVRELKDLREILGAVERTKSSDEVYIDAMIALVDRLAPLFREAVLSKETELVTIPRARWEALVANEAQLKMMGEILQMVLTGTKDLLADLPEDAATALWQGVSKAFNIPHVQKAPGE